MPTIAAAKPAALMTGDDLLALGTDFHGELVRGRLIEMAPATWGHGRRSSKSDRIVGDFVERHSLGMTFGAETGFYLSRNPDTVRAPDVAFVRAERIPADADGSGFFDGPPDLAVEILSPGDRTADALEKVADFLRAGTVEVWVIDPRARTITLYVADRRRAWSRIRKRSTIRAHCPASPSRRRLSSLDEGHRSAEAKDAEPNQNETEAADGPDPRWPRRVGL